ncbi:MAG: hypothetical protein NTX92_08065 [Euryarchaeota archaeon]|nr:hypothetical protein [Euryarchaeota archaeon]
MVMLPTIAATQTTSTPPTLVSIPNIDMKTLRDQYNQNPSPQTIILLTLGILLLKLLRWGAILVIGGVLLIILGILSKRQNTTGITC